MRMIHLPDPQATEALAMSARDLLPLPSGERVGMRGSQATQRLEQPLTQPSPRGGGGL